MTLAVPHLGQSWAWNLTPISVPQTSMVSFRK
jgi:hypothetical protein